MKFFTGTIEKRQRPLSRVVYKRAVRIGVVFATAMLLTNRLRGCGETLLIGNKIAIQCTDYMKEPNIPFKGKKFAEHYFSWL